MSVTGFIFSIETVRAGKGTTLRLKVNFTPEIIMLTKEVINKNIVINRNHICLIRYEI